MWMYTKHGAYSVVTTYSGEEMQVRSRHRCYLEDLLKNVNMSQDIIVTPTRDYEFRIIVSHDQWATIAEYLMSSIQYSDFKTHLHNSGFFSKSVPDNYGIYTGAYNSYVRSSNSIYANY